MLPTCWGGTPGFEDQDAFRLLALLLDKLLRGGRGSRPAKQDGLTVSVMELRALAVRSRIVMPCAWQLAAQITQPAGPPAGWMW